MWENHSPKKAAPANGAQVWTGRGLRRRHRYDGRVRHRPGVLQNRDERRDRRLRLATCGQPGLMMIVTTHITYHLAKERIQQAMGSAAANERTD